MFVSLPTTTRCAMLLALALLTGCAAVAPPSHIPASQQQLATRTSPAAWAAGVERGQPASDWWQALADPRLDSLLQQAMQHNHQRQAALATVRAARCWTVAKMASRISPKKEARMRSNP